MSALSTPLEFVNYLGTASVTVMYPNSGTTTQIYYSQQEQGNGYYGSIDGIHTVMYTCTQDFVGTVTMQATLATLPEDSDWFSVTNTTVSYAQSNDRNTSTVDLFNFNGNFVWVRSIVSIDSGAVQSVLYNH
jgi:hypothetical protein